MGAGTQALVPCRASRAIPMLSPPNPVVGTSPCHLTLKAFHFLKMPRVFLAAKGWCPHAGVADLSMGQLGTLQSHWEWFYAPDLQPRR